MLHHLDKLTVLSLLSNRAHPVGDIDMLLWKSIIVDLLAKLMVHIVMHHQHFWYWTVG